MNKLEIGTEVLIKRLNQKGTVASFDGSTGNHIIEYSGDSGHTVRTPFTAAEFEVVESTDAGEPIEDSLITSPKEADSSSGQDASVSVATDETASQNLDAAKATLEGEGGITEQAKEEELA